MSGRVNVTEKLISDGLALLDLDADGVGHLRLNRPEASNGMDVPFLRALYDAVMAAHGEPRLRVLLITAGSPWSPVRYWAHDGVAGRRARGT